MRFLVPVYYDFNLSIKRLPFPNSLSTERVPPCASTKSLDSRHSEITVEYALMIARVDSLPKVLYVDFDHIAVLVSADNDATVFFGITYGIAYKIGKYPCYFFAVDE